MIPCNYFICMQCIVMVIMILTSSDHYIDMAYDLYIAQRFSEGKI